MPTESLELPFSFHSWTGLGTVAGAVVLPLPASMAGLPGKSAMVGRQAAVELKRAEVGVEVDQVAGDQADGLAVDDLDQVVAQRNHRAEEVGGRGRRRWP